MPAALSFASTTAQRYDTVTVNATGLTPSTMYYATFSTTPNVNAHRMDFTTDGSGNATFTYVPTGRSSAVTCVIYPKTPASAVTSSNTLTVV